MPRRPKNEMTPYRRAMISLALPFDPPPVIKTALEKAEVPTDEAIGYLRCSPATEAQKIISIYDSLTEVERREVSIDHLIAAAKEESITPPKIIGIITEQMFLMSGAVASMIAASKAPDVVRAAAWYAGGIEGHQDRKMLLQTVGTAPVPKNQQTFVNISGNKIDKSIHINQIPTLESVVGDLDESIIDAE